MAIWVFPLKSVNGSNMYGPDDFVQFYANLFSTGVIPTLPIPGATALQVAPASPASLHVNVGAGGAVIGGGQIMNTASMTLEVPVPLTTQARTDSVVVQWNKAGNSGGIVYKENSTQVVQTDDVYELQLATIQVPANATTITSANITDRRADETVCGYSSPFEEIKTGDLLAQFKAELDANEAIFSAWFENVKGQLSTDAAGNLQNQIDDLNSESVKISGEQTIDGEKTFTEPISGDLKGNADSATLAESSKRGVVETKTITSGFGVNFSGGAVYIIKIMNLCIIQIDRLIPARKYEDKSDLAVVTSKDIPKPKREARGVAGLHDGTVNSGIFHIVNNNGSQQIALNTVDSISTLDSWSGTIIYDYDLE